MATEENELLRGAAAVFSEMCACERTRCRVCALQVEIAECIEAQDRKVRRAPLEVVP